MALGVSTICGVGGDCGCGGEGISWFTNPVGDAKFPVTGVGVAGWPVRSIGLTGVDVGFSEEDEEGEAFGAKPSLRGVESCRRAPCLCATSIVP